MEKVRIQYESDPGMHKKAHIVCEGSPLELEIGAAAILHQVSKVVAEEIGNDQNDVAQHIFGAVINKTLKDKEKKSE